MIFQEEREERFIRLFLEKFENQNSLGSYENV